MGLYDTFGDVQLKVGLNELNHYKIGDSVPIPDGIYIGYEGVVIVVKGTFVAEFTGLMDKWGGQIDVSLDNPITKAVEGFLGQPEGLKGRSPI